MNVNEAHCSNCGSAQSPSQARDGYSACCNDRVCDGSTKDRFACKELKGDGGRTGRSPAEVVVVGHVEACCSAAAQQTAADARGWEVVWREI